MQSRAPMNVQRAWSGRHSNGSTCLAANPTHGETRSRKFLAASARAVRPASLAASAMLERLEENTHSATGSPLRNDQAKVWFIQGRRASSPSVGQRKNASVRIRRSELLVQTQVQRRKAKPSAASTNFVRGTSFGSFASGTTQRTMHAGSVPQNALPNPSIERTSPGKPGAASHLKR
jgi:hypothetical protein